jgi:hypothetical protein
VGPVLAMKDLFREAGDGAHTQPRYGIGWGGEDHPVVEEDGLDRCH